MAESQVLGQGLWSLLLLGASTGVQRLWRSNTCSLVRLLFCGTCGLAIILLPLTKSQPVGCVHNGGASSTPMSDTASDCSPLLSHCWSWCPRPLYFHGRHALLAAGYTLWLTPCFGIICLPEDRVWGNRLGNQTRSRKCVNDICPKQTATCTKCKQTEGERLVGQLWHYTPFTVEKNRQNRSSV